MKNWLDPKVTLHGDTRRAGTFIPKCRYLLGVQVEQDLRFGRTVSRQRYTLGNGVEAIITHEAPRTYIHINGATGGQSQESPYSDHSRYFAVAYNIQSNTSSSAAWNSPNGIVWNQLVAPPAIQIYMEVLEDGLVLLFGTAADPNISFALWLVDSRTGAVLDTLLLNLNIQGSPLNGITSCNYIGNFKVWLTLQTPAALWSAVFDYRSFTAQSVEIQYKIMDVPSDGFAFPPIFSIGSRRVGQLYADGFVTFVTAENGTDVPVAYWLTSQMQTVTPITLPPYTVTGNPVKASVYGGPSGSVACMLEGLNAQNYTETQVFIASDVTAISWGPPFVLNGYNPIIGYTPPQGWVVACYLDSTNTLQFFISRDGSEWTSQPPILWAPYSGVSFFSSDTKTLIPEGTALLTNTEASIVGPPAPFTINGTDPQYAYGYSVAYTGPNPAPWLNIYSS